MKIEEFGVPLRAIDGYLKFLLEDYGTILDSEGKEGKGTTFCFSIPAKDSG